MWGWLLGEHCGFPSSRCCHEYGVTARFLQLCALILTVGSDRRIAAKILLHYFKEMGPHGERFCCPLKEFVELCRGKTSFEFDATQLLPFLRSYEKKGFIKLDEEDENKIYMTFDVTNIDLR